MGLPKTIFYFHHVPETSCSLWASSLKPINLCLCLVCLWKLFECRFNIHFMRCGIILVVDFCVYSAVFLNISPIIASKSHRWEPCSVYILVQSLRHVAYVPGVAVFVHPAPTYELIHDLRSRMPEYNITFSLLTPVIAQFLVKFLTPLQKQTKTQWPESAC
jgi:hypothetical protein